jgi:acylpyruvate hydrolase
VKLASFRSPDDGATRAGVVDDDRIIVAPPGTTVRGLLDRGVEPSASAEQWRMEDVELLAPIPNPGTVYAAGLNYRSHVLESGWELPRVPIIFLKALGSIAPPNGIIRCPRVVQQLDYEGELAAVVGSGGRIAGFCVANDVTARDLQMSEPQWSRSKGADTFCPIGPWVTTVDELPDPLDLRLRTWVNDELRQDARTTDLLFDTAQLADFISQTCTLVAGDLILTGTPGGVGEALAPPQFLRPGDQVRVEVDGLGSITQRVEAATGVA